MDLALQRDAESRQWRVAMVEEGTGAYTFKVKCKLRSLSLANERSLSLEGSPCMFRLGLGPLVESSNVKMQWVIVALLLRGRHGTLISLTQLGERQRRRHCSPYQNKLHV